MKPFNLQEALAGKKVTTQDGREVTQLTKFEGVGLYSLVGAVGGIIEAWPATGRQGVSPSSLDLFMASEKKSGWANIFSGQEHRPFMGGEIHKSQELAFAYAHEMKHVMWHATIEISWEE